MGWQRNVSCLLNSLFCCKKWSIHKRVRNGFKVKIFLSSFPYKNLWVGVTFCQKIPSENGAFSMRICRCAVNLSAFWHGEQGFWHKIFLKAAFGGRGGKSSFSTKSQQVSGTWRFSGCQETSSSPSRCARFRWRFLINMIKLPPLQLSDVFSLGYGEPGTRGLLNAHLNAHLFFAPKSARGTEMSGLVFIVQSE